MSFFLSGNISIFEGFGEHEFAYENKQKTFFLYWRQWKKNGNIEYDGILIWYFKYLAHKETHTKALTLVLDKKRRIYSLPLFTSRVHFILTLILRKKLSSHLNTNGFVCWSILLSFGAVVIIVCRLPVSGDILQVSKFFRYFLSLKCTSFWANVWPFWAKFLPIKKRNRENKIIHVIFI